MPLTKIMLDYNLDVCCLQETKIKLGSIASFENCTLLLMDSTNVHYEMGFAIGNNCYCYWLYYKCLWTDTSNLHKLPNTIREIFRLVTTLMIVFMDSLPLQVTSILKLVRNYINMVKLV